MAPLYLMKETKINFNLVGLTKNEILSRVSEIDIFNMFSDGILLSVGRLSTSPLRDISNTDSTPSFSLYYASNGELRFKDFGGSKLSGNCFDFVKYKLGINYDAALKIIHEKFDLNNKGIIVDSLKKNTDITLNQIYKKDIIPIKRKWNIVDYNYFTKRYGLPLEFVESKGIYPCKYVYLLKNENDLSLYAKDTSSNPIYCWEVNGRHKVYRPLNDTKNYKWISTMKSDDFQNVSTCNRDKDILFISKAMKDCLILEYLGYAAIAPGSEVSNIASYLVDNFKQNFKTIYIFYDNDETGSRESRKLSENIGLDFIEIPDKNYKDISDYVEEYGLEAASQLIKNLINGRK